MKKINDKICFVLERFVILFVAASVIDVTLQVVFRYFLHNPIDWTEQLARYLFLFMCMYGLPVAYRNHGLIAFDLLLVRFPIMVQRIIELVSWIIVGAYGAFYFIQSYTLFNKMGSKIAATCIHIPEKIPQSAQLVCSFFIFWFSIELIIDTIKKFKEPAKVEAKEEVAA